MAKKKTDVRYNNLPDRPRLGAYASSYNNTGVNTGDQNLFSTIAVSGQTDVVADSTADTLTLVAGSNITITTNAVGDSIAIATNGVVEGVVAGAGISVDNTDPANPVVNASAIDESSLDASVNASLDLADSAVQGPSTATDNAVARYDSTTGKLIQNSLVTISDTGGMTGMTTIAASGIISTTGNVIRVGGNSATLRLNEADQAADSGFWAVQTNSGDFRVLTATDGEVNGTVFLAVDRSGTSVTNATITLNSGSLTLVGGPLVIPDEAYGSSWNGSLQAPTKNAIYDKIQTIASDVLFDHFTDANNSGTGETDLYTDTLAAAQLANNGEKLIAQYGGVFTGDATSTQRLKAYFGGTLIFDTGALGVGVSTTSWDLYITVIRVSSSVVRCSAALNTSFASFNAYSAYTEVTGLTLANTQVIKITGTAAGVSGGSNQITAKEGYVEFKPAA